MKKLLLVTLISLISFTVLSQSCLPEGISFTIQEQIDNFQTDNPNCTEIEGKVFISGNDITNLDGLSVVTSIGGYLWIGANASLTSLTGLDSLTSIGGGLKISGNDALTSLTGLDNIDADSITNLSIYDNLLLSTCEVQSICDYLVSPNGEIEIRDNAEGCNSEQEVEEACTSSIIEESALYKPEVIPNPVRHILTIETKQPGQHSIEITSLNGQLIFSKEMEGTTHQIDLSSFKKGVYVITIRSKDYVTSRKIIKL